MDLTAYPPKHVDPPVRLLGGADPTVPLHLPLHPAWIPPPLCLAQRRRWRLQVRMMMMTKICRWLEAMATKMAVASRFYG